LFIPKKTPSTDVTKKVFICIQSGTEEKIANIIFRNEKNKQSRFISLYVFFSLVLLLFFVYRKLFCCLLEKKNHSDYNHLGVLPEGFKGDNLMFTSCEGNNCFIIQKLFQDDYNLNGFFSPEDNKIIS
jgi:hypothetical protein